MANTYWDVRNDEDDISDEFDSYKEALEEAKRQTEKGKDPCNIYEHRMVATVEHGPVIVTEHKK